MTELKNDIGIALNSLARELNKEEKTAKISFSVGELQVKSEEEKQKMIADKLASQERKSFFDYLMSLGK